MAALTKEDLVTAIAEANGYPRNRSVELVENLLELIKSKLAAGENVLIGFEGAILSDLSGSSVIHVKKVRSAFRGNGCIFCHLFRRLSRDDLNHRLFGESKWLSN